jgi:cation diffusion facilitator CzcD-associated flavoprotein CzcO
MSVWAKEMPAGMLLRSPREASNIADPKEALTLPDFERARGEVIPKPTPLERFVEYGLWFQQHLAHEVDGRRVERIERTNGSFGLTVEGGASLEARRVVVAAGISPFAHRPAVFEGLPPRLVSHSGEHSNFDAFAGCKVAVVGGGQSALECAALLHEAGAQVEVLARAEAVHWLVRSGWLHRTPLRQMLYAPADVGPAGASWLISAPAAFTRLPRRTQRFLYGRATRPAGAAWLIPRLRDVPLSLGRCVLEATEHEGGVRLQLDDGSERLVDHVLLGTGYRIDVARYSFLDSRLLDNLKCVDGMPVLNGGYESTVPGLHFIGAPAAYSFGPLMRFVAGTGYTARVVSRAVKRSLRSRPG